MAKDDIVQLEKDVDLASAGTLKHHEAADEETAKYTGTPIEIDPVTERKLFWKVCRRLLPIMLITYFCQSLDKGTIGFSSIMGILDDARLQGQQYSWLGTILYIGILVGEYPQNYLLQKFPVGKFLAAKYVDITPSGKHWLTTVQRVSVGKCDCLFSRLHELPFAHGCAIPAGSL